MRDLALTAFIFGMLPVALRHTWVGCLLYMWISIMNPHRLTWGFAYDFPFAMIVGIVVLLSLVLSVDRKRFPVNSLTIVLLCLAAWMNVTQVFALEFELSIPMWDRVMKNLLMLFIAFAVFHTRKQLDILIWVLVFSIGFYSIKGGIFTIMTGGQFRVYGPPLGVINENNSLAVATIMIIPIMRYLQLHASPNKWVSRAFLVAMGLSAISALGSQSRGALLAIGAMTAFFWFKSRHKITIGIVLVAIGATGLSIMSERWEARMQTIETYEEDGSAQGRLFAWETMYNLAKDRPLVGGGFSVDKRSIYNVYSPDPSRPYTPVAHSIYFQMLGEHGFVGLGLFLLMGLLSWRYAAWILRNTKGRDDLKWAQDLAAMIQVSLIAYAVGGAFLNLAHFELPYYICLVLVVARSLVTEAISKEVPQAARAPGMVGRPVRPGRAW